MSEMIAYYRSPIGTLYIKSSDDSISDILFNDSSRGVKVEEKDISFSDDHSSPIRECFQQLDEYFSGKRKTFSFPFQQPGTEFQKEVWAELLNIPFGKRISYQDLSKRIGNVKAIRAVGTTNGKNRICIVVPCHRVIGSNGDLVGYGGDLWRKKWLLEHEAKFEYGVQELF